MFQKWLAKVYKSVTFKFSNLLLASHNTTILHMLLYKKASYPAGFRSDVWGLCLLHLVKFSQGLLAMTVYWQKLYLWHFSYTLIFFIRQYICEKLQKITVNLEYLLGRAWVSRIAIFHMYIYMYIYRCFLSVECNELDRKQAPIVDIFACTVAWMWW